MTNGLQSNTREKCESIKSILWEEKTSEPHLVMHFQICTIFVTPWYVWVPFMTLLQQQFLLVGDVHYHDFVVYFCSQNTSATNIVNLYMTD